MQETYMRRAIELAKKGIGAVNPNPLVGAVIVKDGRIIGEGYHRRYGELHAERDAFAHLTEDAAGAEMYVTLEPCCHYGKQPPCVNAIIEHKISRVYVGSDDPNALVSGKGYQILRDAGIEVITHVLKEECDSLNPVFFHYIVNKTPYVVMKYAMTMDGKIATYSGKSKWITGEEARAHVMEQRNALTGIMVGSETVIKDDPSLTCRIEGGRNPVRIICDSRLRISMDSQIVRTASEVPTILAAIQSVEVKDHGEPLSGTWLYVNRFVYFMMFIITPFFWNNYLDVWNYFPLVRSPKKIWKLVGLFLYTVAWFFLVMFVFVIVEDIFR